jgi:hypothetical protein
LTYATAPCSLQGNTSLALRNLAGVDIRLLSVEDNSYITVRDALNQGTALAQGEINSANITNMTTCTSKSPRMLWSLDSILVPKAYESYYNASTLAHGTRANAQVPNNAGNITPLVTGVTPVNSAADSHSRPNFTLLLLLLGTLLL